MTAEQPPKPPRTITKKAFLLNAPAVPQEMRAGLRGSRRGTMTEPVSLFGTRTPGTFSRDRQRNQAAQTGKTNNLQPEDRDRYDKALKNAVKHIVFGAEMKKKTAVFYNVESESFMSDVFVRMEEYVTKHWNDGKLPNTEVLELPQVIERIENFGNEVDKSAHPSVDARMAAFSDGRIG